MIECEISLDINNGNSCNLASTIIGTCEFVDNSTSYCNTSINSTSCSLTQSQITFTSPSIDLNQELNPNIELTIFSPIQAVGKTQVDWTFRITNKDDDPYDGITTTNAYNVFFDLSQNISFLENAKVTITGLPTIYFNSNNQGILFTTLLAEAEILGVLSVDYYDCVSHPIGGNVPINLSWGWDCDGLPSPTNIDLCQLESETLAIINEGTGIVLETEPLPSYILCDSNPFSITAKITSNNIGHIHPISFTLFNMPSGLTVTGTPIVLINGIPETISPNGLNSWNTSGNIEMVRGDEFVVTLSFLTDCDYLGFLPSIDFTILSYCNATIPITATFPGVLVQTGNVCTNCFTITKTPSTNNIVVNTIIDFYINICNFSPTLIPAPSFQVIDNIPQNFIITSPLPSIPLPWPAQSCTTLVLSGYFDQIPPGGVAVNEAELFLYPPVNGGPFLAQCTLQVASDCSAFADQVTISGHNNSTSYSIQDGEVVYIMEDFIINQNVSYSDNIFYMNPGFEIIVASGNTLALENCRIYACTDMWKGIRIEGGGKLKSVDSEICDAEYAVNAEDLSEIELQNSKFYRNYTGLYIPTSLTGLNSITAYISSCEFATHGTIRPTYGNNQITSPGLKSFSGIHAHDVFLDLGSNYSPNQFSDLSNGVITQNTNISVTNCIFTDIIPDPHYQSITGSMAANLSYNGSGVYSLGRHGNFIKQRGFGMNGQPSFENCRFGLFTDRMNVDSRQNFMTGMLTGYRTNFGSNLTMDITGNKIESRSTAIDLRFNDNADHLWVSDNEIHFGEFVSTNFRGISAIQSFEQNGANNDSRIHNNTIFYNVGANNAANGINLTSTSDYFVTENDLLMNDNLVNINGIIVNGSNNTEISCNIVDGSNNFSAPVHQSSITHVLGSDPIISCNIVDKTMSGIRMVGDAGLDVIIQGNEFNNHNRGLFYNQGLTNGQDRRGNLWPITPTNLTWGAYSDNNNILTFAPYKYDDINPVAPTGKTYIPTTSTTNPFSFDPPDWFIFEDDLIDNLTFKCLVNNDHYCDQFPPCPGCPIDIVIHERIARDSIENAPYTAETLWRLKRELYRKLSSDSTLLSITVFEDFYNEMESSVTAQLEQLTDEQYEIMQLDQSVINNLNQNRLSLEVQMTVLAEQMELYIQALEAGADPSYYLLNIQTIKQNMDSVMSYNQTVFNIADSSLILTADNIRLVNETIYASETIEENEQVVNDIYLSVLGQEQLLFSLITIEQLEFIAAQCPLAGGNAVFRARAILALNSEGINYDDVNICLQSGIILRNMSKQPTAHLYPNPANSSVTLVYELPEGSTAELLLFNSVGMLQGVHPLNTNMTQMSFSTEYLVPGVYHYRVNSNNDFNLNGKLVIIR